MTDAPVPDHDPRGTETVTDAGRDLLDRLAEEYTERTRRGESPSVAEYEARHPEHAERIRKFLATVALMERMKAEARPDRGDAQDRPMPERLGEFRVVRELGRGGMGVVYEAVQESLGRHVALKVIHHVHLDAKRLQRFQREAQAVARLHHTNIVPIFGAGEHDGLPYYVMQYIQGSGLDALLDDWREGGAGRPADRWRFVAGVGAQAAGALQYAHEQGILHRDIKPANLLIDEQRAVWVTDFGLAKLTGHDDLTASGDVIGTLRYLAPEALRGETDARSDVYSLGLTLYELLTLYLPFGELTPSELLRRVGEGHPTRPRRLDPSIPRDLETIVLKATAREPAHRYPTAGAMADDLTRFLEDRPIRARRATPVERVWRWGRRNRAVAALAATAAVSVLTAAVVGWVGYAMTTTALERESTRRTEAERNVALSLEVFAALFDQLSPRENLVDPPPGRNGRPARRPRGLSDDPFEDRPPPGHGHGESDRPPPPHDGDPFGPGGGGPPRRGRAEADTALLRTVLTFYDRFARQNSTNPKLQGEAAWAYRRVGALHERLGQAEEAEKANARAIAIFEDVVAQFPDEPEFRSRLVDTYIMADPWSAEPSTLGRLEHRLSRARVLIDRLAAEAPDDLNYAQARIHVYAKLGAVFQRLKRDDEAEACYRQAIDLGGPLIERSPRPLRARLDRAMIRETLADARLSRGRRDDALALLEGAAADLSFLKTTHPTSPMVADQFDGLAEAFEGVGEPARAEEMTRSAEALRARTPEDGPGPHRPRGQRPPPPPDEG